MRRKSPAKNEFVKALRSLKEEQYLKKHGLRIRRKSLVLQNNKKIISVSLNKAKLKAFKRKRKERHHHMSTGYLQTQLEGVHIENMENGPDVLDILRIDPMSSLSTRNQLMKKYGLLPNCKEIYNRRKQTLLINH